MIKAPDSFQKSGAFSIHRWSPTFPDVGEKLVKSVMVTERVNSALSPCHPEGAVPSN
jgi:hypothetical protein